MKKFEVGKTYRGTNSVGANGLTVVSRTEKTVTVKSCFGEKRCRLSKYGPIDAETITYHSWRADATDEYTEKQKIQDLHDDMLR